MLNKIVALSVRHRFAVILIALAIAAYGAVELFRLPIDAVPDITNRQVQVTTVAPALSPEEIEQRVTYPLETALTGIPGLIETRSISRNGFSQITAVFTDQTDVYFARNQVTERLQGARDELPDGAEPALAPITTGLGEVMMWTVKMAPAKGVRTILVMGDSLSAAYGLAPNQGWVSLMADRIGKTRPGWRVSSIACAPEPPAW